jgi:DNA-binding NtrC family response regulator
MLKTELYQEAVQLLAGARNEFERSGNKALAAHLHKLSSRMATAQAAGGDDGRAQIETTVMSLRQAASLCEYQHGLALTADAKAAQGSAPARRGDPTRGRRGEQAREDLERAATLFRRLSEQFMSARAEASTPLQHVNQGMDEFVLATLRLQDAAFSKDFLFYELTTILHESFAVGAAVVLRRDADGQLSPQRFRGCDAGRAARIGEALSKADGGWHLIAGADHLFHRFSDGGEELVVWVDKGDATLKPEVLASLCRHVELTLALNRQQPGGVSRVSRESGRDRETEMVYKSATMHAVVEQIKMLRDSRTTVLLLGESGTGKELAARAVHQYSARSEKPFIAYNCSSIPRELVESIMFGHRKGAFTGAQQDSVGIIRSADGGTLFLDEIGEMPLEIQPKLLRFLENGEVHPVGTAAAVKTNVRVVAATNQDLSKMVTEGRFRADLWYRINTVTITLPPLRERREDIPLLITHLLRRFSADEGKHGISLSDRLLEELMRYGWPGNVRELANVIKKIVVFTPSGSMVEPFRLAPHIRRPPSSDTTAGPDAAPLRPDEAGPDDELSRLGDLSKLTLVEAMSELELKMVKLALAHHNNNISRAAVTLGLSRYGLQRKLKRLSDRRERTPDLHV